MESRIRCAALRSRIVAGAEAAAMISSGSTVAVGGYTSCGYPKVVVQELVARKNAGEELFLSIVSGANDSFIDTPLAQAGIITRRAPMIESKALAAQVNKGEVEYCEQQMSKMPRLLRDEAFGHIDVAVVEAVAITEEGDIVPTSSVGMVPNLIDAADKVIVEINMAMPAELEGMHDVYRVSGQPIPLTSCGQRIGDPFIRCGADKICAIVRSDMPDELASIAPANQSQIKISENLLSFLEDEMHRRGRKTLPPVQTGFGNLAAEIVSELGNSPFRDLEFFAGYAQEANVRLAAEGKVKAISCGSLQMTPGVMELLKNDRSLRDRILIRNGEISNCAEVISRLGPITIASGIEMDIYGNVNSSHISGSKVVNGLGGGANFAENAGLSVLMIVSETKGGAISAIVPMVSHQDISEHDIDVVITENGVADLRGKSDVERAEAIINNCAGTYKAQLLDYFNRARAAGGHHPVLLDEALSWHLRLKKTGTMLAE